MEERTDRAPLYNRDPALSPTAGQGFNFYHMDLYDSEDRLKIFPEEKIRVRGEIAKESKRGERAPELNLATHDVQKEVEELAQYYGLEDDKDLEGEIEVGSMLRSGISEYRSAPSSLRPHTVPKKRDPGREEKEWQYLGEEADEEDRFPAWGSRGQYQELREAYRYARGRSSEDYECYVIPEEEDEEEAADIFCVTCKIPIRAFDNLFGEHKGHEVTQLNTAAENAREEIHKNMFKLEEQIIQMENFASHLEEVFITIEENFGRQEQNFELHYNEILETLAQKYEEKMHALGEKKREKLEALYGQLVSCGENLDTCKELMETIEEICHEEKVEFIKDAVTMADRLGEFLKTKTDVELSTHPDFEDQTIDFSDIEQLMDSINAIPAPCAPVINTQTPNSATGTSVKVCWSLFSDDTVESYQLSYKPVSDGAQSEEEKEFSVNVKESHYSVANLVPNTQYEFWVTASNSTGVSPPSERAVYVTAPSPPIIKSKDILSCEHAALVRWESGNMNPVDSYTIELSKVDSEEPANVVTESIVGIPTCESLIQLQPGESYLAYIRAINVGGPSERSEPATIHTTGTYFHLNKDTSHPLLSISEDGFTIVRGKGGNSASEPRDGDTRFTRCVAVMGSLIPIKGQHYWEVEVNEQMDYKVGVAFEDIDRQGDLGADSSSWCMSHTFISSRHKYEFLHNGVTPEIQITVPPKKIGILLDYDSHRLSFFNVDIAQHLYTFSYPLQHFVQPCFSLEKPGLLRVCNGISMPKFATVF
ncbi:fibronectin type III and SPRY domain-containing protein 2 [Trichosurus vulpecula]|uniref:fibronectin type III and SPRY domain-containing protein 2 n=1 Tax=Trichosurus vulpecula TaxID=9337 RepID=UPI00186B2DFB|nr:fibronectin type III and SPRY domain-containing protein 2 [Trichosurus vulpecula]